MQVDASSVRAGSVPKRSARVVARWVLVSLALLAVLVALIGLAFAGSSARLAEGVAVAGIDVGGLTKSEARAELERRFARVARVPIVFAAGEKRFPIKATTLSVEADWASALDTAAREGQGFGPVRGFRRLQTRFFGAEVTPPVQAYAAALDYKVDRIAREIDRRHVEAKLVRRGLSIEVVAGHSGLRLDRAAAQAVIVRSLARLERGSMIALPVVVDPVQVTAAALTPAARRATTALSGPVRLEYSGVRWRLPRWRIAQLLSLPSGGETQLEIAGSGAEAWFARLRRAVERAPVDAGFEAVGDDVRVVPAKDGLAVDVPRTAKALLAAATSPTDRVAQLAVRTAEPERTTTEAAAMGIERRLSSYTTLYAGTSDRITNLQLAVKLVNGAVVAPGATFSFNDRVGRRTEDRGFRSAPVIIKDEYEEAVGGGVSQVATTVFNAAWEAGLKIAERNPHSLYISRYQTGRDATVNYPDLDLKFVNDTDEWVYVAGSSGDAGITVSIYGGGPERRVESSTGTLRETGPAPLRRLPDPEILRGETVIEETGTPATSTTVTRKVYTEDGRLLHDETWTTNYRGEYRVVRYGTKPPPPPKPPEKPKQGDETKPPPEDKAPPQTKTEPEPVEPTAPVTTPPPSDPPGSPQP